MWLCSRPEDPRSHRSGTRADPVERRDAAFSLVEILVAVGIFMTVMVAVLPQLVVGIKGTALANQLSEAKGVAQGRLETMRNLPYHVAPSVERRIDVLDTYFPNLTASTATVTCLVNGQNTRPLAAWTGYVAGGTRCGYEPASGAFYRQVDTVPRASGGVYSLVTDTQFLSSPPVGAVPAAYASTPLTPPAGYDSATQGSDKPPSSQIAVTLTVFYANRGDLRLVRTYTQVSEVVRSPLRVEGKANATAFQLSSADTDDLSVSLGGGIVNLAGSLSSVSKVSATLAATAARQSTAAAVGSDVGPVVAPPLTVSPVVADAGGSLPTGTTCLFACWDATQIERFTASADSGLPILTGGITGDPASALEARGTTSTLSFGKRDPSQPDPYRPGLKLDASKPMVSVVAGSPAVTTAVCGTSRAGSFTGRGYLRSTSTSVDTCAETAATRLSLFPTTFAPAGVLRLTLTSAASQCTVTPTAGTRTARNRYSVAVEYADPAALTGYQTLTLTYDSSSGALPVTDALQALRSKVVGGGMTLGDYVASWSSPTSSTVSAPEGTTTTAEASLPGVVKLLSQPMRDSQPVTATGNPSSAIGLTLGSVGCFSSDVR